MSELRHEERLQPSLLDRLTDEDPRSKVESRDRRVISLSKLRNSVARDLTWLLNTGNLADAQDLSEFPLVAHSVLNYGMTDLTGQTASSADVEALERLLRQVIWDFEPRILRNTVQVRAVVSREQMSHNTLTFEIEGEMWAKPVPLHLLLKTQIDLEARTVTVEESRGPSRT